ncbi:MAG: hypothetical protein IT307_15455 [Chloroflexi bacterium]|nr:hypothetical protein [Chloroflexota bacterium]
MTHASSDGRLQAVLDDLLGTLELPRPTVRFTFPDFDAAEVVAPGALRPSEGVPALAELPAGRRACGLQPEEVSQLALQMERLALPLERREPPPPTGRAETWWLRLARRTG